MDRRFICTVVCSWIVTQTMILQSQEAQV